jgi:hypothetical protein
MSVSPRISAYFRSQQRSVVANFVFRLINDLSVDDLNAGDARSVQREAEQYLVRLAVAFVF